MLKAFSRTAVVTLAALTLTASVAPVTHAEEARDVELGRTIHRVSPTGAQVSVGVASAAYAKEANPVRDVDLGRNIVFPAVPFHAQSASPGEFLAVAPGYQVDQTTHGGVQIFIDRLTNRSALED
jgi:hypothetical protein